MLLPAIPAAVAGLLTLKNLIYAGMGGMMLKDTVFGGMEIGTERKLGKQRISLEKMIAKAQIDAARVENEENRRSTDRYLSMLRETRDREDIAEGRDRQMQLVMAMLGGLSGFRQQAGQTVMDAQRPMPPMALTTLMRGM